MRTTNLLLMTFLSVTLTGCFDLELEIPVQTHTATVAGSPVLFKANARIHGEILQPVRVDHKLGLQGTPLSRARMEAFQLELDYSAISGVADQDDLNFIESMVIYIRSAREDSQLKEIAIAWYYQEDLIQGPDPERVQFETDPDLDLLPDIEEGFELFSKSVGTIPQDDVAMRAVATFVATPQ